MSLAAVLPRCSAATGRFAPCKLLALRTNSRASFNIKFEVFVQAFPMLKAKIISLTGDRAVLSFEDGQSFTIPTGSVEGALKAGQEVAVVIAALGSEDAGRQKLAQDLLNELLKA